MISALLRDYEIQQIEVDPFLSTLRLLSNADFQTLEYQAEMDISPDGGQYPPHKLTFS